MIDQARRRRVFAVGAVPLATATTTVLLWMLTGPLLFLPGAAVMAVTYDPVVAYQLPFLVVPLAIVVFWRQQWWVRWAWLGFLLDYRGLLLFLAVEAHSITGVF